MRRRKRFESDSQENKRNSKMEPNKLKKKSYYEIGKKLTKLLTIETYQEESKNQ